MTTWARASVAASTASVSKRWGSALGSVISDVTRTSCPPSWLAMLPQKFSAATTRTTGPSAAAVAAPASAAAGAGPGEAGESEAECARQQGEGPEQVGLHNHNGNHFE